VTRRQHTTLIVQVRIPVPAGKTQAQTLEWIKARLVNEKFGGVGDTLIGPFASAQTQVKITGRETVYL